MARSLTRLLGGALPELRYLRSLKRVRVGLHGQPVADTVHAVLVWEPSRVVPSYAVPEADITARLAPAQAGPPPEYRAVGFGDSPPLLDPTVPFTVHTTDGEPLTVEGTASAAAFRLADPDLAGYVVLDFDAFDWLEEDQPLVGHPRDPLHRIDVCPSSRRVRIEHEGVVLAETDRASWLFEGTFPLPRYYLPKADVAVRLEPGTLQTTCAYKGHATHWTARSDGLELANIAWSYEHPENDAARVAGLVAFYTERLDLFIDGQPVDSVRTPWSR